MLASGSVVRLLKLVVRVMLIVKLVKRFRSSTFKNADKLKYLWGKVLLPVTSSLKLDFPLLYSPFLSLPINRKWVMPSQRKMTICFII